MNPCSADQSSVQDYAGSEPLDPALADRFALFVNAADWADLDEDERRGVVDPAARGASPATAGRCARKSTAGARPSSSACRRARRWSPSTPSWPRRRSTPRGIRISPRRARLLARSLLAASIVTGKMKERLFRTRARLQPAARLLGRAAERRGDRGRPPRGVGQCRQRGRGVGALVPRRSPARPQARPAARQRQDAGCRLAGDRAVPRRPKRRSAPAHSPSPSTRRPRWVACRSARRGSTTWPRSPRRSCRSRARSPGASAMNEKNTSHPEIARFAKVAGRSQGARGRAGAAVLRLVHGREAAAGEAGRTGAADRGLRRGAAGAGAGMNLPRIDTARGLCRLPPRQHRRPDEPHPQGGDLLDPAGPRRAPDPLPAHRPPGDRVPRRRSGRTAHPDARRGRLRQPGGPARRARDSAGAPRRPAAHAEQRRGGHPLRRPARHPVARADAGAVHARSSTTRRGRCCGRRPRSSAGWSCSIRRGSTHERRSASAPSLAETDRREPVRHPGRAAHPRRRVHDRRADAGGDLRGAAAAARQPRLRQRTLPQRRRGQGAALPRVPARPAAPHRGAQALHPGAAPGARRGDQRHHPPRARAGVLGADEPLLRRRAGARQAAAADERPRGGALPGLAARERAPAALGARLAGALRGHAARRRHRGAGRADGVRGRCGRECGRR